MKATFLETGTSSGIPIVGCDCEVCTSRDPRDRWRRTSLYVEAGGVQLLVDTPPDFREQALAYKVPGAAFGEKDYFIACSLIMGDVSSK